MSYALHNDYRMLSAKKVIVNNLGYRIEAKENSELKGTEIGGLVAVDRAGTQTSRDSKSSFSYWAYDKGRKTIVVAR